MHVTDRETEVLMGCTNLSRPHRNILKTGHGSSLQLFVLHRRTLEPDTPVNYLILEKTAMQKGGKERKVNRENQQIYSIDY